MACQHLSSRWVCRPHGKVTAPHISHHVVASQLQRRSSTCALTRDSQPKCRSLPRQVHTEQEDCQWPEPVAADQHLEAHVKTNGTGDSIHEAHACPQLQQPGSGVDGSDAAIRLVEQKSSSSSQQTVSSSSSWSLQALDQCSSSNSSSLPDSNSQSGHEQEQVGQAQQQQQQQQQQPWPPDVPWGLNKAAQVMGIWLLAYFATGQLIVPGTLAVFNIDQANLSARGAAVLNLVLDVLQVGITVGILARCLRQYEPLKRNLFPISWQGGHWLGPVAAGVIVGRPALPTNIFVVVAILGAGATVFPVVDWLVHTGAWLSSGGVEVLQVAPDVWTAQVEAGLYSQDWWSCIAYTLVVGVFAPIWEEAIFRGFLLRTLMKRFKRPTAVVFSALVFGLCHFNTETFAPLVLLGVVFGWLYVKCNNLLPPMLLHSLWNAYVLGTLILQIYTGFDAVMCSIVMAVGTQVVLLACAGVVQLQAQRQGDHSQQQTVCNSSG